MGLSLAGLRYAVSLPLPIIAGILARRLAPSCPPTSGAPDREFVMDFAPVALLSLACVLGVLAYRRDPDLLKKGIASAAKHAKALSFRVPVAVFSAGLLAHIVPNALIAGYLGPDTGLTGIAAASLNGGVLPGGPNGRVPDRAGLRQRGHRRAPVIRLLTAWSVFALHRLLIYELPLLGFSFSKVRMASALVLPPIAGALAWAAVSSRMIAF